jgi:hypothetical protein
MASAEFKVIKERTVESTSVIPNSNGILSPFETKLEIVTTTNVVIEESENSIRFSLADTNNLLCKMGLNVQSLPASNRMGTNNRMLGINELTTNKDTFPLGSVGVELSGVDGFQSFKELLHRLGQSVVSLIGGCPEGVTTNIRDGVHLQEGQTGRLFFESNITVPS